MIGRLKGTLLVKQAPNLLIEVAGVGYELEAPMTTFYELPEIGHEVVLHTHLVVREDAHALYGFVSLQDRTLFRTLIKVSGVGAKLALTLLSGMSVLDFVQTIRHDDIARLTLIPGVGKKTAERLIVELRDRLKDWGEEAANTGVSEVGTTSSSDRLAQHDAIKDAISALVALGYKPQEASRMVNGVHAVDLASEEIIRQALKSVSL